ncbi:MAG: GNAT family N-acetyltransferase [Agarilytica sp.]
MENFLISEFVEEDWGVYKELRLESLKDSPNSFGSTFEEEIEFAEEKWKSRLVPGSNSIRILPLVALFNESPVGLAIGVLHSKEDNTAHIYQMWVSKSHRGSGIGSALLKRTEAWANELSLESLSLEVATSNSEAVSLYKSVGFLPCGAQEALRAGSEVLAQSMILELKSRNA